MDKSILARAANLLRPARRGTGATSPNLRPIAEDSTLDDTSNEKNLESSVSNGTSGTSVGAKDAPKALNSREEEKDRRRDIQVLPPWIDTDDENERLEDIESAPSPWVGPTKPAAAFTEPTNPLLTPNQKAAAGRKWDHARTREPVFYTTPVTETLAQWHAFTQAETPVHAPQLHGEISTEQWREDNLPNLDLPWRGNALTEGSERRRQTLGETVHRTLMRSAFMPLILRITVLTFVMAALSTGASIFDHSRSVDDGAVCQQQPSTWMAIVVDAIAVFYLIYITRDEYFSRPIGQRRSRDKLRLLFLDMVFIVFSSANTGLAFNTLQDPQWACHSVPIDRNRAFLMSTEVTKSTCVTNEDLCSRQKALCGLLILALFAWLGTFAISILRIVERISR